MTNQSRREDAEGVAYLFQRRFHQFQRPKESKRVECLRLLHQDSILDQVRLVLEATMIKAVSTLSRRSVLEKKTYEVLFYETSEIS
jgi:hypothetical protein